MTRVPPSSALEGLIVLDMTQARAGPICVRQLTDWGANVIKIERPGELEDFAGRKEPDFQSKHRNKRSMILDLKHQDGLAVLLRMVARADVVVENFRPAVKHRLGFDYPSLRQINRRIILGSISAFGQDGPYRDRPGLDQIVQGMSGFMSITGQPGGGPLRAGVAIADITCGLYCAIGILTALLERERSGEGQWVQTSLMEALLSMMDLHVARYLMEGHVSAQVGNQHPTGVPTTHEAVYARSLLNVINCGFGDGARYLMTLPLFFGATRDQATGCLLFGSTVIHYGSMFTAPGLCADARRYGVLVVFSDPGVGQAFPAVLPQPLQVNKVI